MTTDADIVICNYGHTWLQLWEYSLRLQVCRLQVRACYVQVWAYYIQIQVQSVQRLIMYSNSICEALAEVQTIGCNCHTSSLVLLFSCQFSIQPYPADGLISRCIPSSGMQHTYAYLLPPELNILTGMPAVGTSFATSVVNMYAEPDDILLPQACRGLYGCTTSLGIYWFVCVLRVREHISVVQIQAYKFTAMGFQIC